MISEYHGKDTEHDSLIVDTNDETFVKFVSHLVPEGYGISNEMVAWSKMTHDQIVTLVTQLECWLKRAEGKTDLVLPKPKKPEVEWPPFKEPM